MKIENDEIKQFYEKYHRDEITNPIADFMQRERCNHLRYLIKNERSRVLIIDCGSAGRYEHY